MAYYAYKTVRDLLPEHIIKQMGENYEGDGNYDGDQWYAAEAYILELEKQRNELLEALQFALEAVPNDAMDEWAEKARAAISRALGENKE